MSLLICILGFPSSFLFLYNIFCFCFLQVDIWATGVITYILLCGFPPFVSATNNQEELFDQILRGYYEFHSPYWDDISESARELIAHMIQVDQDKRFSAQEVLDHPWVSVSTTVVLLAFFAVAWRAGSLPQLSNYLIRILVFTSRECKNPLIDFH